MSRKKPRSIAFYVYTGSILFHAGLAVAAFVLPKAKRDETIAITLAEEKKKKDPPKPPPPPPTPPPPEKPKPKPAAQSQAQAKVAPVQETKPVEAAPPVPVGADGFADLGMSLGNSDGPGIGIPTGPAVAAAAATATAAKVQTQHKVQQLNAPTQGAEVCNDPVVRPKRKVPVAPKYTMQARQAEIEGVVRVEVTVDESGHVVNARVVSGLGYGLDESALAAARATTFDPATRCGKAVIGTVILPFRFEAT